MRSREPESVPITMIWGAEHDFKAKITVPTALVGATENRLYPVRKYWVNISNVERQYGTLETSFCYNSWRGGGSEGGHFLCDGIV